MLSKNEIKFLRSLHQKKFRDLERKIVVEGERIITDIIARHPQSIERIIVSKNFSGNQSDFLRFECAAVDNQVFEQISASKNPQGVLALIHFPVFQFNPTDFVLVLDGVQDPGNLGTILRTAAWYGVKQIVCSPDTVDVCNPKVVQASMGAVYDVNISYQDLEAFLNKQNAPIYGALLEGKSVYKTTLTQPAILVMGNEGNGIRINIQKGITHPIMIPKIGVGESLNVATATAILLSEFVRMQ
jgi:TrmH family RNA methyltransferase